MNYPSVEQITALHSIVIEASGGSDGLRDKGALESAVAQPQMGFGGQDLYPSLAEKAAALSFSLVQNHPFVDGNKRIGFVAMLVFLQANGHTLSGSVDEQEVIVLQLAASALSRESWTEWVRAHLQPLEATSNEL